MRFGKSPWWCYVHVSPAIGRWYIGPTRQVSVSLLSLSLSSSPIAAEWTAARPRTHLESPRRRRRRGTACRRGAGARGRRTRRSRTWRWWWPRYRGRWGSSTSSTSTSPPSAPPPSYPSSSACEILPANPPLPLPVRVWVGGEILGFGWWLSRLPQELAGGGARHDAEARRGMQHPGPHGGRQVSWFDFHLSTPFAPWFWVYDLDWIGLVPVLLVWSMTGRILTSSPETCSTAASQRTRSLRAKPMLSRYVTIG